ncbi:MAG: flagellar basal body L-ring protein FlgH [Geobacteraceae bacterium]|nr:flagellar basal body L-ring protein FlgH [Geobacteraceae bacterium]
MRRFLVAFLALMLSGCVVQQTEVVSPSFDQQIKPPTQNYSNGSIWQASTIALTEDGKARRIGDIVTIIVTETASASKQAATATGRSSKISAGIPNMLGLEESKIITSNFADLSKLLNASASSSFDGSGSTSRKETLTATISAKVIDVLPNGNLKIEGRRNVKVNYEDQIVTVKGTIRQRDITAENTINSIYVADAQISYSGEGIISDRQKPGWMMNVLDKLWPF